jgi:hypothetical protein|tara:strand:+ start:4304 stop:4429 length:126 start_codon:yes stop_codon:yes gene_type:complete
MFIYFIKKDLLPLIWSLIRDRSRLDDGVLLGFVANAIGANQ